MIDCTFLLRAYTRYRLSRLNSLNQNTVQEQQLLSLVRRAENTVFGRDHDFRSIRSISDYQSRVPIRTYEDFWNEYWREPFPILNNISWPGTIPYYCWTSGTTSGKRKFIPYTDAMSKSYSKAGTDIFVHHLHNRQASRLFGGKSFMLSGSTHVTEEAPGVYTGEVSGISAMKLPLWARPFYFPPRELSDISDWVVRTQKIAAAARGQDVRLIGGMPSWLLIFLEKFSDLGGVSEGIFQRLFPNLELLVHGGVKFDPYLEQYQSLLKGTHAEMREIYPASEGFFAVADRGYGEGLRLVLDHDIFYEFVPVEELENESPTRHTVQNAEKNVNYALVISSCSGMWSYCIGDTVRFVDLDPARILITGRTSYFMSAFGEHLIQEEIEQAVHHACSSLGITYIDYSMGVRVAERGSSSDLGNHIYYIEPREENISGGGTVSKVQEECARLIDEHLNNCNDDYLDHRQPGCGLRAPEVILVRPGTFASWMESRGKLGDQFKVPRIINDSELFSQLSEFVQDRIVT